MILDNYQCRSCFQHELPCIHVSSCRKHFCNISHCTSGSSCQTNEIPFQFPRRQSMEQIALSSYYCLLYESSGMERWCENAISEASYQSEYRVYHIRYGHTLGIESCHDANFAVTIGAAGCCYDNLWYHQWLQSWHHDDSVFSVVFLCCVLVWIDNEILVNWFYSFNYVLQGFFHEHCGSHIYLAIVCGKQIIIPEPVKLSW